MQVSDYFIRGDVKGAIEYMREHEEYKDILPAYISLFENNEYIDYEVPELLNNILKLYQIYYHDIFYCGVQESEAADKLIDSLTDLLTLITKMMNIYHIIFRNCLKIMAIMPSLAKPRGSMGLISGKI